VVSRVTKVADLQHSLLNCIQLTNHQHNIILLANTCCHGVTFSYAAYAKRTLSQRTNGNVCLHLTIVAAQNCTVFCSASQNGRRTVSDCDIVDPYFQRTTGRLLPLRKATYVVAGTSLDVIPLRIAKFAYSIEKFLILIGIFVIGISELIWLVIVQSLVIVLDWDHSKHIA